MTTHLRIGTIARLTGISAERLRLWEKRYGWPSPVRTTTDHRLYAEWIVDEIRAVVAAIRRGARIGELIADGRPRLALRPQAEDPWRAAAQAAAGQPGAETPARAAVMAAIAARSAGRLLEAVHRSPTLARAAELPTACWLPTLAATAILRRRGVDEAPLARIGGAIAAQAAALRAATTGDPLPVLADGPEDGPLAEVAAALLRLAGVAARPAATAAGAYCLVAIADGAAPPADPQCRGWWSLLGTPHVAAIAEAALPPAEAERASAA